MDADEKAEIYKRYVSALSPSAKKQYPPIAKRILSHIDFNRESVKNFIQLMRNEGYSDGSVDFYWRVIRRLFRVANVPWPFERHDNPVIHELNVMAIALPMETIHTMIETQKAGKLTIHDSFFLAMSTIYGLRDAEMASLTPENFDLENQMVFVETKKYGRQRFHSIPDEIFPIILEIAPHLPPTTRQRVIRSFHAIERASGLRHTPDTGWHSVRRSLDHFLLKKGLDIPSAHSFMRWKRVRKEMAIGYAQVRFAGSGGGYVSMSESDADQDKLIFDKYHPFLPLWRG